MSTLIPVMGPVVSWANAFLSGRVSADDTLAGIAAAGAPSLVAHTEGDPEGWALMLGRLRSGGATGLRLLLPAPGDLSDLPGPRELNEAAALCGECALTTSGSPRALLPISADVWALVVAAASRPLPSGPGEATRALAEAMAEGAAALERLSLAAGRDRAEVVLRHADDELVSLVLPDALPQRAVQLIQRGTRLSAAIAAALASDGAAVTAAESSERARTLTPLARAARRALEAGFSALPE